MKSTLPPSVGLHSPDRQRRLLTGIGKRSQESSESRKRLLTRHRMDSESFRATLDDQREQALTECRRRRRTLLGRWDTVDEELVSGYESTTLKLHEELRQLSAQVRKTQKKEQQEILRKLNVRREAIQNQYDEKKLLPIKSQQEASATLDQALQKTHEIMDNIRSIVVRRLDHLPDVPAIAEEDLESKPESVEQAQDAIFHATRQLDESLVQLHSGTIPKTVDTFWILPGICLVFLLLWMATATLLGYHSILAMGLGLVIAAALFLSLFGILQIPLRRHTRRVYPDAERLFDVATNAAKTGKDCAMATATQEGNKLAEQRDTNFSNADRWKEDEFAAIDAAAREKEAMIREKLEANLRDTSQRYATELAKVDSQMSTAADTLATFITDTLAKTNQEHHQQSTTLADQQQAEKNHLDFRFRSGIAKGLQRITKQTNEVRQRFPDWPSVTPDCLPRTRQIDYLPVGQIDITNQLTLNTHGEEHPTNLNELALDTIPKYLPVTLHRRLHGGLIIDCPSHHTEKAVEVVQASLWRFLTGLAPGSAKLTLIDPIGRGQHFAGLVELADYDPTLVGHRVWTTPAQIESRLAELTHHTEDVLQSCLRDRYGTIEHYNQIAGSLAEPYRLVAAVGLPAGLNRESAIHLRALLDGARRCGTFLLLVRDPDEEWPLDFPSLNDPRLLRLRVTPEGNFTYVNPAFSDMPFIPQSPPGIKQRETLIAHIGQEAVDAAQVEIPLERILSSGNRKQGQADSAQGLTIPIGSQGANRPIHLKLGDGVKQHVLIAGKTGSGKSTLLHSIITAGSLLYPPDQLQMYLLDFKKGVEFKSYSSGPLPHARVIGIESEREFGRSVLERLDSELHDRGEKFRAAGVQEISDYRNASDTPLPRILLIVDEFQELFIRDDRLAGDCAMFLDRLVRQGRSFGMHVILSSQSLAGAYSLPRATLGQMAVRIALQCGESDAALILSDDNTAARILGRPGEAIYNDASGLVEGNLPFQVAWLDNQRHEELIAQTVLRDGSQVQNLDPPVIFEGNRPSQWIPALANSAATDDSEPTGTLSGLLGESIEIGPPTTLRFRAATGRNAILIAPTERTLEILAATLSSMAADWHRRHNQFPDFVVLDGQRAGKENGTTPATWLKDSGIPIRSVRPRDAEQEVIALHQLTTTRLAEESAQDSDDTDTPTPVSVDRPTILVISPLERFRELRQSDQYSFSLDASDTQTSGPEALQSLLRDGPLVGVFTILCCTSAETLSRWLPRNAQHDLELRLLGKMSAADSSHLIDTPIAAELSAATMLLYDDADGRLQKFRTCDVPNPETVKQWLKAD